MSEENLENMEGAEVPQEVEVSDTAEVVESAEVSQPAENVAAEETIQPVENVETAEVAQPAEVTETVAVATEPIVEEEEEEEESKFPPVIDLKAIMQPIPGENPSGESQRYSGLYDEISEARRADEDLAQGVWQEELKLADYPKVIELAVPALATQSKDLQIASYLSEALCKQHQILGLRDSLKLLSGLQARFWDTLYPEIDEGDMEARANAIEWMVDQASIAIKEITITQGEGYNYLDWADSKNYDFPENLDLLDSTEKQRIKVLMEKAEREKRCTTETWSKAVSQSRRAFYEDLHIMFTECWEEYNKLNQTIEEKFDPNQMPGLGEIKKSLDLVEIQVNKLLEIKREEEPDEIEEEEEEGTEGENGASGKKKSDGTSSAISNRRDALKRLAELAVYFKKTEPHSPVSYLVTRAVKWGNMPLETWLQDVIKDENVLFQIRQTLGFNTNTADDSAEDATAVTDPTAV